MEYIRFGTWEYIYENYYINWQNVIRPPQLITKLNKGECITVISDDVNNPDNNFIRLKQNLNTGKIEIQIVDKYLNMVKKL